MNDKKIKPAVPQFKIPSWLLAHVSEVRAWGPVAGEATTCWVEGCERSPHLHGLCRRHYFRAAETWKRPRVRNTQPERPSRLETSGGE
ncbi:hypothetical protein AB0E56_18370 [Microbacterium sp. NPDC028030]|uniref:hypothetical protein n=1 Tax=Microbacterium sp. NPDC028030 TaxID=3155124 RepID=UPI0033E1E4C4